MSKLHPGLVARAAEALRGVLTGPGRARSGDGFSMGGAGRRFLPPYLAASQRGSIALVTDLELFYAAKFLRLC